MLSKKAERLILSFSPATALKSRIGLAPRVVDLEVVAAGSPRHSVRAFAGIDYVIAGVAEDKVAPNVTPDVVVVVATLQTVAQTAAAKLVIAGSAAKAVGPLIPLERVDSGTAKHRVAAAHAEQPVVAPRR